MCCTLGTITLMDFPLSALLFSALPSLCPSSRVRPERASKLALSIPAWRSAASTTRTLLEFVSVGNVEKNKKKTLNEQVPRRAAPRRCTACCCGMSLAGGGRWMRVLPTAAVPTCDAKMHLRPRREVFDAVTEDHREEEGRGKTSTFRTHKEPLIHSAGNFSRVARLR